MLTITMLDASNAVTLLLYYTVYEETNVITRRVVLQNHNVQPLTIRRLLSLTLDMPNDRFRMMTLDGGWIKEAHLHERPVSYGIAVNASTTGDSSKPPQPRLSVGGCEHFGNAGHCLWL